MLPHLFGRGRFSGNRRDYYDPRNSLLDQVLERQLGIPITLAIVAMEVGRRLGVPLSGVGMPGHFLVGSDGSYFDPFHQGRDAGCQVPGRLGIGTQTPSEQLHVVGNVQVTGTVNADAGLKIKGQWSLEVPDYVFEAKYKPMGLSDLESYVRTNKHLPEVPSATEMKNQGMDVATMNLTLLKKVEELTLYVIEQDKKIKELSAKIQ